MLLKKKYRLILHEHALSITFIYTDRDKKKYIRSIYWLRIKDPFSFVADTLFDDLYRLCLFLRFKFVCIFVRMRGIEKKRKNVVGVCLLFCVKLKVCGCCNPTLLNGSRSLLLLVVSKLPVQSLCSLPVSVVTHSFVLYCSLSCSIHLVFLVQFHC